MLLLTKSVTSLDAGLELILADILALGKSDIQGLVVDHLLVHLRHRLGSFIRVAEADKSKAFALSEDTLNSLAILLDLLDLFFGLVFVLRFFTLLSLDFGLVSTVFLPDVFLVFLIRW